MKKTVISIISAFFISLAFVTVLAQEPIWEFDNGTLTVFDFGSVSAFDAPDSAPWISCGNDIKRIIVEDGIAHIPDFSFNNLHSLESVSLPSDLKSIGNYAFSGCVMLPDVDIPNGVKSIGIGAFSYCARLGAANIPDGVSSIGYEAFYACQSLAEVHLPSSLIKIEANLLDGCKSLTSVTIPESVEYIDHKAFASCISLKHITIPSSVESMAASIFLGCSGLSSVTIEEGIEHIDIRTFSGCSSLKSIYLPDSLKTLGDNCFLNCSSLESVRLGSGISKVRENTFNGCSSLEEIIVTNKETQLFEGLPAIYTKGLDNFKSVNSYVRGRFVDVLQSDWFNNNVSHVYNIGIMLGTGENEFSPYGFITYAQAITMAARIHSIYYNGSAIFSQDGIWYKPYLDHCIANSIISDMPDDMNRSITRFEFVKLINALPLAELAVVLPYAAAPDCDDSEVEAFYRAGVLAGSDLEGNFLPDAYITRAEAAAIIARMLSRSQRITAVNITAVFLYPLSVESVCPLF